MEWDEAVLGCEVWDAGKGDDPYRVLNNRFVVARKVHMCAICLGGIGPGDVVRAQTEVADGQVKTFRFCPDCCCAMAETVRGANPDPLIDRFDIGAEKTSHGRPPRRGDL